MKKIVIHPSYGAFGISDEMLEWMEKKSGEEIDKWNISRDDPLLVECVETLKPDGLKIVEIPDDVKWMICEYDGAEWIAERHRTWY